MFLIYTIMPIIVLFDFWQIVHLAMVWRIAFWYVFARPRVRVLQDVNYMY